MSGYRADGSLGQFSFVLPEYDVVLAITSGTSDMNGVMKIVWSHLLPAIHDGALAEDAATHDRLTGKLNALSRTDLPSIWGIMFAGERPTTRNSSA